MCKTDLRKNLKSEIKISELFSLYSHALHLGTGSVLIDLCNNSNWFLNNLITIQTIIITILSVLKIFPTKKTPGPGSFIGKFTKIRGTDHSNLNLLRLREYKRRNIP